MGWIPGRPVSRIVLVGGGATRMPAIGRLLTQQLTSVVPEKTVNPSNLLDGTSSVNQTMLLLNPMQAVILKAMAVQDGKDTYKDNEDDEDDDDRKYPYC
jgi:actin-related protein